MYTGTFVIYPLLIEDVNLYIVLIIILLAVIVGLCIYIFRMHAKLYPEAEKMVNAVAEQLFDSWPVGIVVADAKGRINRINKQAVEDLQQKHAEALIGKDLASVLEVIQDKENVLPRFLQKIQECG